MESFLNEGDIEREKILESFGYKMIRLNRFNVGLDPVKYIDKMLAERLSDLISSNKQQYNK